MTTDTIASRHPATLADFDRQYIDGKAVSGEGEAMKVISPGTEEVIAEFAGASEAQHVAAIAAARKAFDSGVWSGLTPEERAGALRRMMAWLSENRQRLIDLAVWEVGCPVNSPIMGAQIDAGLKQGSDAIDLYLKLPTFEENPLPFEERFNFKGPLQSLRKHAPLGVVSAISAYNFPFYINIWKVIPALAAGNCVILRPSPFTPLTALIFGQAAEAAGLPAGVFNVLAESGTQGGVLLTSHPDVDMVAFTGSSSVGSKIAVQGAATMKRLQLELGGKSAHIFLPDSVANAHGAPAQVCMAHAGQGCSLPTRVLVPEEAKAATLEAMAAVLANAKIGDPSDPETQVGPVISAAQRARCQHYVDLAVDAGARVVTGGKPPASPERGFYFEPTILDMPDNSNPAAQEEIFGPVVGVIGYRDVDHAVEIANDSVYGLAAYISGQDVKQALGVAARMRAGTVNVNGGASSAYGSSGGWRMSGLGRERGVEGMRIYQQVQTLAVQGR